MRNIFLFICILIINVTTSIAQENFPLYEDSLKKMSRRIIEPEHDFERLALNLEFKRYFEHVLNMRGAMEYPFDSLTAVSRHMAPDGSFRIISWYVPLEKSNFDYFGFFQSSISETEHTTYELNDQASKLEEPIYQSLDHENWYGAWYTDLIHEKHHRKDYYLLLGWRGDNPLTRKRIIDPVKVMGRGRPSFGEPVFRYKDNRHRRIIFEYSAKTSMSMRYETQPVEGVKRPQEIIIFDRIAPTHSFLEGHYQFYVPETNIFDGFMFEDGKWIFITDIDAKNPERNPSVPPSSPKSSF